MKYTTNITIDIDERTIVIEELQKFRDSIKDGELSDKIQEVLKMYDVYKDFKRM